MVALEISGTHLVWSINVCLCIKKSYKVVQSFYVHLACNCALFTVLAVLQRASQTEFYIDVAINRPRNNYTRVCRILQRFLVKDDLMRMNIE